MLGRGVFSVRYKVEKVVTEITPIRFEFLNHIFRLSGRESLWMGFSKELDSLTSESLLSGNSQLRRVLVLDIRQVPLGIVLGDPC